MSYLSQMGALAVQNFLSAAVGIAKYFAIIPALFIATYPQLKALFTT